MTHEIETSDSFPLRIWSGLFKKKHWSRMGPSIWLFGTLIDKVTKEENGKGFVLGGKPITYATLEKEMSITRRQYVRHIDILRDNGYISTKKTPHGLVIVINNSKKFSTRKTPISDKNVTTGKGVVTEKSQAGDKNVPSGVTKKSQVYIDNKVDSKGTKKEIRQSDSLSLWNSLYTIFNLPVGSMTDYLTDINDTLRRLGIKTTTGAVEQFKKRTDDHPPDGKVKSISQFLHWKKIDEYVAMIPREKPLRYYTCPQCIHTLQVVEDTVSPGMLELSSMMCHNDAHAESQTRKDTTAVVRNSLDMSHSSKQIKVILTACMKGKL